MQFTQNLTLRQFFHYCFGSAFDKPVLRTIEYLGVVALVVVISGTEYWVSTLLTLFVLYLLLMIFLLYVYKISKSVDGGLVYKVKIDAKNLSVTTGNKSSFSKGTMNFSNQDVKHSWFIGRFFFIRRKLLSYPVYIDKSSLEAFKKYVAKNGWLVRPTNALLKYIARIAVSVVIIGSILGFYGYALNLSPSANGSVLEKQLPLHKEAIIKEVNTQRTSKNAVALNADQQLNASAATFCSEMSKGKFFDHVNPVTGRDGYELALEKYPDSTVYQLLLSTTYSESNPITEVVGSWNKDSWNRDALYSPDYSKIGAAVCEYTIDDEYTYNVVVHLAS